MKAIIVILSMSSTLAVFQNEPVKPVKNIPPQANAGADYTVPSNDFVQLDGTSSREEDGIISRYQWKQIGGAPLVISNANAAITGLTGYSKGEYTFRLTVADEKGAVSTDDVKITIQD
ncbi:PKD domain-containing protein [Flavihumibacter fluvii]|uniref:PKD domain-containing protein n=1 Tax=Flavihumibacter fluvii TaxID=2838157 RepID=UPI001BDDF311|nr:PKD domain-containing protein [Flavihumibacter fluvii]ULQ53690.1 PKD domain-containing protein [Flavihumibacter fluvii]